MNTLQLRTALSWTLLALASVASVATSDPSQSDEELDEFFVQDVALFDLDATVLGVEGEAHSIRGRITFEDPDDAALLMFSIQLFTLEPIEDLDGSVTGLWDFSRDGWAQAAAFDSAPFKDLFPFAEWGSSGTKRGRSFTVDCQAEEPVDGACVFDFALDLSLDPTSELDSLEFQPTLRTNLEFDRRDISTEPLVTVEFL